MVSFLDICLGQVVLSLTPNFRWVDAAYRSVPTVSIQRFPPATPGNSPTGQGQGVRKDREAGSLRTLILGLRRLLGLGTLCAWVKSS